MNMHSNIVVSPELDLVRIETSEEVSAFLKKTAAQYTFDIQNGLKLTEAAAARKSRRDMEPLLDGSLAENGHTFFHSYSPLLKAKVGASWIYVENDISTAWLHYIFIHPDFRRNGFAGATLRQLHAKAREMGCDQINLNVYDHNPNARHLYRSLGYQDTAYTMRLTL